MIVFEGSSTLSVVFSKEEFVRDGLCYLTSVHSSAGLIGAEAGS